LHYLFIDLIFNQINNIKVTQHLLPQHFQKESCHILKKRLQKNLEELSYRLLSCTMWAEVEKSSRRILC